MQIIQIYKQTPLHYVWYWKGITETVSERTRLLNALNAEHRISGMNGLVCTYVYNVTSWFFTLAVSSHWSLTTARLSGQITAHECRGLKTKAGEKSKLLSLSKDCLNVIGQYNSDLKKQKTRSLPVPKSCPSQKIYIETCKLKLQIKFDW